MTFHQHLPLVLALLALSAFSALAEAALLSVSRFKVRHWVEKNRFGAVYAQRLKDDPAALLSTLLITNNLVNTALAAIITSISLKIFQSEAIAIATGIATFLILVFGDIIPKSFGANNADLIAPLVAAPIWYLSFAFYPVVYLLELLLQALNRLVGAKKLPMVTREEMRTIVKASEEEGSIKEIEKKMMQRIFDFETTTVSDVMTPKRLMVPVSASMTIKEVLQLPTEKMYSRFPVYEKSKDNIVGILYLKDTLEYVNEGKIDTPVSQIMRKPFFVFKTKKMDSMLKLFQGRKQHMAVVIDERGNIVGLVTIENILEEIVGEIIDESDKINPSILQISKNEWLAKGSTEIDEINSRTGVGIKSGDFVDLDNFVISTLGREPRQGEEINYKTYRIIMEEVQGKKVLRARILRI